MSGCRVSDDYQYRGIDTVFLENERLRVELLAGKGGDVTELRDKRTDVDVTFETPHRWYPPGAGAVGAPDGEYAFMDHYPGGWQSLLPAGGGPSEGHGAPLALHGESSLIPFETTVLADGGDRAAVRLEAELSRFPLRIRRDVSLGRGSSTLVVEERATNTGEVTVDYSWLQHVALGRPLVGPSATLEVPCDTVLADPNHDADTARFEPGATLDWPRAETADGGTVDLREFPDPDEAVHDILALADLREGRYGVANPDLDLSVSVRFPDDLYEYVWYWGAFGGFEGAPYFGRNYNVGLEPSTSVYTGGLQEAVENGTANQLDPGETVESTVEVETGPAE
jgi:galactose mutarotase-like enzyme